LRSQWSAIVPSGSARTTRTPSIAWPSATRRERLGPDLKDLLPNAFGFVEDQPAQAAQKFAKAGVA
jgi:hypothetical protein